MTKRLLAWLLVCTLVLSGLPVAAFAEEPTAVQAAQGETESETEVPTEETEPETQPPTEQEPTEETVSETQSPTEETEPETQPPTEQEPTEETEPETQPPTEETEPETQPPTEETEPETQPPTEETEPETQPPAEETEPETQPSTEQEPTEETSESEQDEEPLEGTVFQEAPDLPEVTDDGLAEELGSSEERLMAYLYSASERTALFTSSLHMDRYEGNERKVYAAAIQTIVEVAAGRRSTTEFTVELDDIVFTSQDLGVSIRGNRDEALAVVKKRMSGVQHSDVLFTAIRDCPYEVFWWSDMVGCCYSSYSCSVDGDSIRCTNIVYLGRIGVSEIYRKSPQDPYYYVDASKTAAASNTMRNARAIVKKYSTASDYAKLYGYAQEICDYTDYDYELYEDLKAGVTVTNDNPWHIIYVFDGDPSTKVVCEAYAEAFAYLCELTSFNAPNLYVFTATGMTGGNHMWNIVHMPDNRCYLVDVTGMDGGWGRNFFLLNAIRGSKSGSDEWYYEVGTGDGSLHRYTYEKVMLERYRVDELALSDTAYRDDTVPGLSLNKTDCALRVGEGETLKISATGFCSWFSSDDSVVSVSSSGRVTAKKEGEAVITVVEYQTGYRESCRVKVSASGHVCTSLKKVSAQPMVHTATTLKSAVAAHYKCSTCGKLYTDRSGQNEVTLEDLSGPAPTHSFGTAWKSDSEDHWRECSCGAKSGTAKHFTDTEATCTHAKVCDICARQLEPKTAHRYRNGVCTSCDSLDPAYSGLAKRADGKWYYVTKGVWNADFTGVTRHAGTWYYVRDGIMRSKLTGLFREDSKWLYAKNGVYDATYTGLAQRKDTGNWYYVTRGIYDGTFTGVAKYADKWYYVQKGVKKSNLTGLFQENGKWQYAKNGVFDATYTGLAQRKDNGKWYYVTKGIYDNTFTGVTKYAGKWYYVQKGVNKGILTGLFQENSQWQYAKNGVFDATYTGLAKHMDTNKWYYVTNGIYDSTFTGVTKYAGTWYYVQKGTNKGALTGLFQENGKWQYAKNGVFDATYTGLAQRKDTGNWYYVTKGLYDGKFTGVTKYGSTWYYVQKGAKKGPLTGLFHENGKWQYAKKGVFDATYTGLAKRVDTGKWFYVTRGIFDADFTGVAKYDGKWYYVENGAVKSSLTGLFRENGQWKYARSGVFDGTYTGLAQQKETGKLFYVTRGIFNSTYNGQATYAGKTYTVVNGKATLILLSLKTSLRNL